MLPRLSAAAHWTGSFPSLTSTRCHSVRKGHQRISLIQSLTMSTASSDHTIKCAKGSALWPELVLETPVCIVLFQGQGCQGVRGISASPNVTIASQPKGWKRSWEMTLALKKRTPTSTSLKVAGFTHIVDLSLGTDQSPLLQCQQSWALWRALPRMPMYDGNVVPSNCAWNSMSKHGGKLIEIKIGAMHSIHADLRAVPALPVWRLWHQNELLWSPPSKTRPKGIKATLNHVYFFFS